MLAGKRILLIIGGGVAAFKSLTLIRILRERGASVVPVLTPAAQHFVTPLSASALAAEKVYTELFDLTDEAEMGHIELSRDADLVVVAPATADLLAKMANGLANDLASTLLMATDKAVLVAPAMNVRMWEHPATQRNVAVLTADGVHFAGPTDGAMACGEFGPGRLAEPAAILDAIRNHFASASGGKSLAGKRILVTAGPTHEPIDPVRYIANRSSGKQGYAIAAAAAAAGAEVVLVAGPVALPDPAGVVTIHVESAREMLAAVEEALPADAGIFTAAVADWRPDNEGAQKIKKVKGERPPDLALAENPDILATVASGRNRPGLVIGFAAETEKVVEHATAKRERKKADWIVANDVSPATGVMGGDRNTVHLITADGVDAWPTLSKVEVAQRLVERLADAMSGTGAKNRIGA